jgi:hypothetical protein
MAKLTWDDPGEHFFEIGVDRGVLYVGDNAGVAWNGLISVDESPTGGDPTPYFLDGLMYLMVPTAEWFEATITAFQRPAAFGPCDGSSTGVNGMIITGQRRQPFGLTYRTMIGNQEDGPDHGYLIHLVYNAMVGPSSRNHATMDDGVNPAPYSWPVKAKPAVVPGYKPTSHLIINSLTTPPDLLSDLEDVLYGSSLVAASLPTPEEIFELGFGIIVIDNGDGTFSVTGPDSMVFLVDPDNYSITSPSLIFLDADTFEISSV